MLHTPKLTQRLKGSLRELGLVGLTAGALVVVYSLLSPAAAILIHKLRPARSARPQVATGATIKIAGVSFAAAPLSVVLITSPTCQYCIASSTFHGSLFEETRKERVPLYILVPSVTASQKYLRDSGLGGTVKPWEDLNADFRGTPTILLIDTHGAVRASLVGRLTKGAETQLLQVIQHPNLLDDSIGWFRPGSIGGEDLARLRSQGEVSLLDVRERDDFRLWHKDQAVNIPLAEFDLRAPFELHDRALQVIDCSEFSSETCTLIVERVRHRGFKSVAFSEGMAFKSCDVTRPGP
jgi:hypothetical protein